MGIALFIWSISGRAEASTTTAFASNDPGVRATAMGGAYTGLGGDPMALYWNPATLFLRFFGSCTWAMSAGTSMPSGL